MALLGYILEVTTHDGKKEVHGCGVGGTPDLTAEDLAQAFADVDHFQGKAKKITIKHRSELLKLDVGRAAKIKPRLNPKPEVEIHPNADHVAVNPDNPTPEETAANDSLKAAREHAASVANPDANKARLAKKDGDKTPPPAIANPHTVPPGTQPSNGSASAGSSQK